MEWVIGRAEGHSSLHDSIALIAAVALHLDVTRSNLTDLADGLGSCIVNEMLDQAPYSCVQVPRTYADDSTQQEAALIYSLLSAFVCHVAEHTQQFGIPQQLFDLRRPARV